MSGTGMQEFQGTGRVQFSSPRLDLNIGRRNQSRSFLGPWIRNELAFVYHKVPPAIIIHVSKSQSESPLRSAVMRVIVSGKSVFDLFVRKCGRSLPPLLLCFLLRSSVFQSSVMPLHVGVQICLLVWKEVDVI